ncbi:MAG TPA: hypothetical protein VEU96_08220 [Bryobacteraceae bacterium]|nr:hypothetical protein [Bryobacteraceae bacterium]
MKPPLTTAVLVFTAVAAAQPPVAPTPEPVGSPRGENVSNYNIMNSFETGYRFRTFGGSFEQYRSTVNYGDGIRLFSSFLTINSKDGHGKYFDDLSLTTQGLGNDPYESATLRIQKNRLYRYDMVWRLNDYYNPGLRTGGAAGFHLLDTEYTTQDHDFTLFPQSNVKFFLGYSRGNQNGPALSSIQLFGSTGNDFPLFENVRRVRNEYRIGNEVHFRGVRFTWMRGWEGFKEDSNFFSDANPGLVKNNSTAITSFARDEPFHGTSPYWRAGLFTEGKYFAANGRFTYTSGRRGFVLDENAAGTGRFGVELARQIVTAGIAQRPALTADLTLSFFPTSRLTVTNHTAVHNIRINGDSSFAQFDNATLSVSYVAFEFLGIRTVANETEANFQATRWLGFYGGYQYSDRQIRSIEQSKTGTNLFNAPSEQSNALNSGTFGVRLRPLKPLTIVFNGDIGRSDHPLTPIADRNYHDLGARVLYKAKTFQLSASTRANYNNNSVSLATYSSHSRNYSANAAWTPRDWFSLDAGYSKLHLDTLGGITYFASAQSFQGQSLYISNLHAANLTARFDIRKRADLFIGYSHTQDTGSDQGPVSVTIAPGLSGPPSAIFAAQTFPLTFRSPSARFSLRFTEKLRWNVGYQYYGYNERFYNSLDFRAHTGYTSLLWSF